MLSIHLIIAKHHYKRSGGPSHIWMEIFLETSRTRDMTVIILVDTTTSLS